MDGFETWADQHATVFGLNWDSDMTTLLSYESLFDTCGFAVAELAEATAWLAAQEVSPKRMDEHRVALLARVRFQRAAVARAGDDSPDVPRCALCGGGGFASVPDLAGVVAGEWVGLRLGHGGVDHRTYAVTCSCYKGRTLNPLGRDERRLCGNLAGYELANPHWRAQVAQLHHERLAEARAELAHAHGPLAELMRRLLAGARDPGRREDAA